MVMAISSTCLILVGVRITAGEGSAGVKREAGERSPSLRCLWSEGGGKKVESNN